MRSPRIAVVGSGANGTSVAVDLTRAEHDVTVIEQWPDHTRVLRERGATVITPDQTTVTPLRVVDFCDVATLREPFDVVFLLVKAYDSRWATELIRPLVAEDGLVVGVQNGMTADDIAAVAGPERTLGCVIEITSAMDEPGVIQRHSPFERSWFAVGALTPTTAPRVDAVAELLRNVGSVEVVDDIRSAKWMKLVSNATTLVTTAIAGLRMIEASQNPLLRRIMLASGEEALAAGEANGRTALPIFGLRAEDLGDRAHLVEGLLDTLLAGFVLPSSRTTVLQDWTKGRRSEVGDINGEVVRASAETGLPAPVNAAVCEVAARIEEGSLSPSEENIPLLGKLAGIPMS